MATSIEAVSADRMGEWSSDEIQDVGQRGTKSESIALKVHSLA